LWVRTPPWAWIFVCCECCVLSGRGLCDGLITRPEDSYRMWCVVMCDLETSWMRSPWPTGGLSRPKQNKLQPGSSRLRSPMGLIRPLFHLTLPTALFSWGRLKL
jgi:hypothetical protein